MRNKKGAIESQFSWIFVFVIGALILMFFVGFVNTQRQQSEQRLAEKITKDLNTIITQTSVSVGKANVINIPNKEIEFNCDNTTCNLAGCTSGFKISNTNVGWDTPVQVIFSPSTIKGRSLLSWLIDWNMPYHSTNFLYLTSPDVRYIFVKDPNNKISNIFQELPVMINKELVQPTDQIINKNNYKVKLIYYKDIPSPFNVPTELENMPDKDVTAIKIEPSTDEEIGTITFYKNQNNIFVPDGSSTYYLGAPSLYGAIFSEDKGFYECNMKKALLKLHMATKVYYGVINIYYNNQPDVCKNYYNSGVVSDLGIAAQNLNLQDADTIFQNAKIIRENNHNLKIYSCPLIY